MGGRGLRPVTLLLSGGYQGSPVPAERNRPSIAWISTATHSDGIHRRQLVASGEWTEKDVADQEDEDV